MPNFRILARQALYFSAHGHRDRAYLAARQALQFFERAEDPLEDDRILERAVAQIFYGTPDPRKKLHPGWGKRSFAFRIQTAVAAVMLIAFTAALAFPLTKHRLPFRPAPPAAEPLAVPLPLTGPMNTAGLDAGGEAPLVVETLSSPANCFLKLTDWKSKRLVRAFFVRAGEQLQARVPLGHYDLQTACGNRWFGERNLFGAGTVSQTAASLTFERRGQEIAGYRLSIALTEPHPAVLSAANR